MRDRIDKRIEVKRRQIRVLGFDVHYVWSVVPEIKIHFLNQVQKLLLGSSFF